MHYLFGVVEDSWLGALDIDTVSVDRQDEDGMDLGPAGCRGHPIMREGGGRVGGSWRLPLLVTADATPSYVCLQGKSLLFMPRLPESYSVWLGRLKGPGEFKAK